MKTVSRSLLLRLALASASWALTADLGLADEIVGRATVVDGDTIEIHGERIRLWGIDAPESDQLCRNSDSDLYPCGRQSAASLAAILYAIPRPVTCTPKEKDQYGRTVAVCLLGVPGPDLGQWLVSKGLALDWPKYSQGQYAEQQRAAEKAERGMWAGSFVEPWRYRECVRAGGRPAACSDDPAPPQQSGSPDQPGARRKPL
ncbi:MULTISPECIES: thermonuclease family protein [unclassified Bradyrhizobium]|uniref:thermonuclease family protein n=1 Tax=unclassified Bradyrhizobium TaxID=2631580 RepID=UPI0028E34561|nr:MULTISPECIES: thermonuclease family protein [unclassified Bradyrhizobium]